VALVVRAKATGSFVSALKLSASNDSNPANDTREVSVEITGANVAAVSESSAAWQWRRRPYRVLDARLVSAADPTAVQPPLGTLLSSSETLEKNTRIGARFANCSEGTWSDAVCPSRLYWQSCCCR
jgi:hypothetical protein